MKFVTIKICGAPEVVERHFKVKFEDTYANLKPIKAGTPQGCVLDRILHLLHTCDVLQKKDAIITTAIQPTSGKIEGATTKLQKDIDSVHNWTKNGEEYVGTYQFHQQNEKS